MFSLNIVKSPILPEHAPAIGDCKRNEFDNSLSLSLSPSIARKKHDPVYTSEFDLLQLGVLRFSLRPLVMEPSSGFYWDPVLVLDFKGWEPIQGDGWDIHGVCLLYQENLVKIQENINNLGLKFLKPSTFHCC